MDSAHAAEEKDGVAMTGTTSKGARTGAATGGGQAGGGNAGQGGRLSASGLNAAGHERWICFESLDLASLVVTLPLALDGSSRQVARVLPAGV